MNIVDTLGISWYLEPKRLIHGLDSFGQEFGIPKPKITDWEGLTIEEYIHRCEEDVKINGRLWKKQQALLTKIYGAGKYDRLVRYITFKLQCARKQEVARWKLDKDKAALHTQELSSTLSDLSEALSEVMPDVEVYVDKVRPSKPYKKDGSLSVAGAKWANLAGDIDHDQPIRVLSSVTPAKPSSNQQVKAWLYELGWVPSSFKFKRDKDTGRKDKFLRSV